MSININNIKKLTYINITVISAIFLTSCSKRHMVHSQNQVNDNFRQKSELFDSPSSSNSSSNSSDNKIIIKQTKNKFKKAINEKNAKIRYVPVPVPGQLMPIPKIGSQAAREELSKAKPKTPLEVVRSANDQAMMHPTEQGYFNSVMTYEYMPGAVYVVYTAPLNITDVMLQKGERIISFAAGDSIRWTITRTRSGAGDDLREHLIIRPQKINLENTILITTNQRVYHLVAYSTHNKTYMVAVKWNYQEDFLGGSLSDETSAGQMLNDTLTLDIANLNFNYQFGMLEGDKPSWFPLRVFSSNRQTFIEFNKEFNSSDLPILYVQTNHNTYATMVNWRLIGRFMVVDKVISRAKLVMGIKKTGLTSVLIEKA
jgi:type IV secretion system protein TrbG